MDWPKPHPSYLLHSLGKRDWRASRRKVRSVTSPPEAHVAGGGRRPSGPGAASPLLASSRLFRGRPRKPGVEWDVPMKCRGLCCVCVCVCLIWGMWGPYGQMQEPLIPERLQGPQRGLDWLVRGSGCSGPELGSEWRRPSSRAAQRGSAGRAWPLKLDKPGPRRHPLPTGGVASAS